ncbi:MAG: hypothetical protein WCW31_04185 [Patescibacteria group bacterium]
MSTLKAHAVLLISYEPETTQPIDVAEIAAKYNLQHCVSVELEIEGDGHGGHRIDVLPPREVCHQKIYGQGRSISAAVVDWFQNLVSSFYYQPLYFKKREERADSDS